MVFGIKTDSDQHAVKWEIRNKKREVKEVKRVGGEGQDPNPPTLGPICWGGRGWQYCAKLSERFLLEYFNLVIHIRSEIQALNIDCTSLSFNR